MGQIHESLDLLEFDERQKRMLKSFQCFQIWHKVL